MPDPFAGFDAAWEMVTDGHGIPLNYEHRKVDWNPGEHAIGWRVSRDGERPPRKAIVNRCASEGCREEVKTGERTCCRCRKRASRRRARAKRLAAERAGVGAERLERMAA